MVIDSRLRTIDGKVNLVARANREALLAELERLIGDKPIIGRIYLLLDGVRNQEEVTAELVAAGTKTSKSAVSRWLLDMSGEHGVAERVPTKGRSKTYRKNREMEHTLNLTKKVERWLTDLDKPDKASPGARRAKS